MELLRANHYEVSGSGIDAAVTTTGVGGDPVVQVTLHGRPLDGARLSEAPEGLEVTALVEVVADESTTSLRLVLPDANVGDDRQPVDGFAVITTARSSLGGSPLVHGPLQRYDLRTVTGWASAVQT